MEVIDVRIMLWYLIMSCMGLNMHSYACPQTFPTFVQQERYHRPKIENCHKFCKVIKNFSLGIPNN